MPIDTAGPAGNAKFVVRHDECLGRRNLQDRRYFQHLQYVIHLAAQIKVAAQHNFKRGHGSECGDGLELRIREGIPLKKVVLHAVFRLKDGAWPQRIGLHHRSGDDERTWSRRAPTDARFLLADEIAEAEINATRGTEKAQTEYGPCGAREPIVPSVAGHRRG